MEKVYDTIAGKWIIAEDTKTLLKKVDDIRMKYKREKRIWTYISSEMDVFNRYCLVIDDYCTSKLQRKKV